MDAHGLTDAMCCFMKQTGNYSITFTPHLCVHFAVLEGENHRIQPLCMKGTVTSLFNVPVSLLGGSCVFLDGLTFVCLSSETKKNVLAAFVISESITQQFSRTK